MESIVSELSTSVTTTVAPTRSDVELLDPIAENLILKVSS